MRSLGTLALVTGLVLGRLTFPTLRAADAAKEDKTSDAPKVQLAILLDTSGSMQGLINQARTQLWKIVNELATAKRDGRSPDLQVALYEYGKDSLAREKGFVRQIVPFTDDLDKISEELFALTTNGGEEYCGTVIAAATKELAWSASDDDLKLIFVAGNEPFTQGTVSPKEACGAAIARGITVNTIFCGAEAEGVRTGWKEGAQLADGTFLSIDQNQQIAEIETPFDKQLGELSGEINETLVTRGGAARGLELARRARTQDVAAASVGHGASAGRAAFKASGKYFGGERDLVTAIADGEVKLDQLKEEELPEDLKKLEPEKREAYIKEKSEERAKIQERIKDLTVKRNEYIADQRRKEAKADPSNTFDAAVLRVLREQASRKQYTLESEQK